jgi:hypothetical protein
MFGRTRHQWLMPMILATQEAEIRRFAVWSQPRQVVLETLSRKMPIQKKSAGRVTQVLECLPSKHRPWVQTPVPPKKRHLRKLRFWDVRGQEVNKPTWFWRHFYSRVVGIAPNWVFRRSSMKTAYLFVIFSWSWNSAPPSWCFPPTLNFPAPIPCAAVQPKQSRKHTGRQGLAAAEKTIPSAFFLKSRVYFI